LINAVSIENQTIFLSSLSNSTWRTEQNITLDQLVVDNNATEIYNLSTATTKFTNINDSYNSNMRFYGLSSALIYYSNNSIAGNSNINLNDGNINITLSPNNYSYVLDNFNLTIGSNRENDPIYNGTFMNNTLTSTITFSVFGGTPTITSGLLKEGTTITDSVFTIPHKSHATIT